MKRKVPLRIPLQRALDDEKKQRILKGKWSWSCAPKLIQLGCNGFTRYNHICDVLNEVYMATYK